MSQVTLWGYKSPGLLFEVVIFSLSKSILVMSCLQYHFDQMSHRSQIPVWGCPSNAYVIVFVLVVVFVFVICIFVGQIMSPHDFKYLKGIWSCSEGVFWMVLTSSLSSSFWTQKFPGLLVVFFNNGQSVSPLVTRSPYELSGDSWEIPIRIPLTSRIGICFSFLSAD